MSRSRLLRASAFALAVAAAPFVAVSVGHAEAGGKLAGAMDKPYTVTIAKVSAVKGQPSKAVVQIKPAAGYHMNLEFPSSLKLTPPAGVTATKAALTKADAKINENEGSFTVELTSSEAGQKTVPGALRFAVCTATTCDPQSSPVSIVMDVK